MTEGLSQREGLCVRVREQVIVDVTRDEGVAELTRGLEVERGIRQVEETEESAEVEEKDEENAPGEESGGDEDEEVISGQ